MTVHPFMIGLGYKNKKRVNIQVALKLDKKVKCCISQNYAAMQSIFYNIICFIYLLTSTGHHGDNDRCTGGA